MFRCRGIEDGVKPTTGSVLGAVFSSVEVQAPSFHTLVCVIFSVSWTVAHTLRSLPERFRTAGFAATDFGRLSDGFLDPAGRGPVSHALYVIFCVVAVAIAVAKSERKVTPPLPHPQPLGRDTKLAGGFRDPVRGAPILIHISKILGTRLFRYRN
jgi:hypothetical protein